MNKYFIAKIILSSEELTRPLNAEIAQCLIDKQDFGGEPETKDILTAEDAKVLLETRLAHIQQHIHKQIRALPHLSGADCVDILWQYEDVKTRIARIMAADYPFTLDFLTSRFHALIDDIVGYVTLDHIYRYEAAEKELTGLREVPVIVNGNRDRERITKHITIRVLDNKISIEKCREMAAKIEKEFGVKVDTLHIPMSVFVVDGDDGECLLDRDAVYCAATDELRYQK